jgi:hypothetical protein
MPKKRFTDEQIDFRAHARQERSSSKSTSFPWPLSAHLLSAYGKPGAVRCGSRSGIEFQIAKIVEII